MSVSTDGIVAFGFDLGDDGDQSLASRFGAEEEGDDGESFEFDEWVAKQAGAVYPENSGWESAEYKEYAAKRDAAVAACPVEAITHCSYDYPMHFLAVRGTQTSASRGTPEPLHLEQPSPKRIAAMKAFCKKHGIEWKEPGWYVFSLWG